MKCLMLGLLGAALSLHAQTPDFTPPNPLFGALLKNDSATAKRLLAEGANPNEGRFLGTPALFLALVHYNPEVVEAMIAKGADVKATDAGGTTTLMMAAYHESANPALAQRLIDLGVDPNAKNKKGETALMWALRRGPTPVVDVLRNAGAANDEMVRQSVEKAIALLQKSGPEFVKVSGCVSCHNQSLPQMAYAIARPRGMAVDEKIASHQVKAVMAMFRPMTAAMAAGKFAFPDPPISMGYLLIGLAAEGYAPDATTAAMAGLIETQQTAEGSFIPFPMRPPMESSWFTSTALGLRGLQLYGKDSAPRVERARQWLESNTPHTQEDRAMHLLGLAWAKSSPERMSKAAAALAAEQHADGGWSQLPALETDSYATGMALVALQTSGQISVKDPIYQRGVAYLLRTQLDDGSWFVRTRTIPFQQYRESGFPHGRHQWISAAGTAWAAMALGLTQPIAHEQVTQMTTGRRSE